MEDILNINKFAMLAPLLLEGNLSHLELGVRFATRISTGSITNRAATG